MLTYKTRELTSSEDCLSLNVFTTQVNAIHTSYYH